MNKNNNSGKIISALINRAEKDIKADELLSSDAFLKEDSLRLFLLQQASEKIIKAWFLKNIDILKLISQYEKKVRIDKKIIDDLPGITGEDKEKLLIISNFQKDIFNNYHNVIIGAIREINEKSSSYFLRKNLKHNPVKYYLSNVLKKISDYSKFFLLFPDEIILKYSGNNDRIRNIKNISDSFKGFINFTDDIAKQINTMDPDKIIQNLKQYLSRFDDLSAESVIYGLIVVVLAATVISNANEKEKEEIGNKFLIFYNLYSIVSYFPLVAYLANFENISRYDEISNDYSEHKNNSQDMKIAMLYINDLHTFVKNLIDNAKIILNKDI